MTTTSGARASRVRSRHRRDSSPQTRSLRTRPRRCIYFFAELMKLGVALAWCFKAYQENDREVVKHFSVDRSDFCSTPCRALCSSPKII